MGERKVREGRKEVGGEKRSKTWTKILIFHLRCVLFVLCVCVFMRVRVHACMCAAQEARRGLMLKKEELERSLASSEEEAQAVKRALAAAERRGNDLARKLREAEEREAAMHSEQVRICASLSSCLWWAMPRLSDVGLLRSDSP